MIFEYPSEEEWIEISNTFPIKIELIDFEKTPYRNGSIRRTFIDIDISYLKYHLYNRLVDVKVSFIILKFLFLKGIPDEDWFISPGKNGVSVSYFPHFQNHHFKIKNQFDFYTDIFYYKLFTAFDSFGHIINLFYDLNIKEKSVTFCKAIQNLKGKNIVLYKNLNRIISDKSYKKAKNIRNEITHRYLPHHITSGIKRTERSLSKGIGDYTTSKNIIENVDNILDIFLLTLRYFKEG